MKKYIKKFFKGIIGKANYNNLRANKIISNFKIFDNNIKEKVNSNKKFKDIHKDERCFILGNGPSLKSVDLNLLKDEIVFSVNNFCKIENYKNAKTNYHFWIDGAFFDLREDMQYDMDDVMNNYNAISTENAECFVPIYALEFIRKNKIDQNTKINYLVSGEIFKEYSLPFFDLCSVTPAFTTVVQYCIMTAIYMGFKEIYLLGCDSTGIVGTINCALEQENNGLHAYDNDNSTKELTGLLKHWNMSEVFYDQYLLFNGYEYLNDYCKNNNIKLVNCTPQTLITSIEKGALKNILSNCVKE